MATESPIQASDNWFIGEDRTFRFTIVDSASVAVDITGFTFEFVMRKAAGDSTAILTISNSAFTHISEAGGVVDMAVADSDTISLSPARYQYAMRRTNAGNEVVLAFGEAYLQQAATR